MDFFNMLLNFVILSNKM